VDYFKAAAISAAGMAAEKARVEAATLNLANMHTSAAPGTPGFRPMTATIHAERAPFALAFEGASRAATLAKATLAPQTGASVRMAFEPGHPDADADGMVAYPAVDSTQEMMTVMTALRAYEANLAALQVSRTLAAKALEIGSNS
jgi:flagellar basal-body rod protein FlgC